MNDRDTSVTDDELLGLLASSMAPVAVAPTPETVNEIRMLAARHHAGARSSPGTAVVVRWRRRLVAVGVATATVVVGTGTAFAAGAPVPEPLRALAVEVGLPVTPPAVVNVQNDTSTLQGDLTPGSRSSTTNTVHAAQRLAGALDQLGRPDLARVSPQSQRVLGEACHSLFEGVGTSTSSASRFSPRLNLPDLPNLSQACVHAQVPPGLGGEGTGSSGSGAHGTSPGKAPVHGGTGFGPGPGSGPSRTFGGPSTGGNPVSGKGDNQTGPGAGSGTSVPPGHVPGVGGGEPGPAR